MKKLISILIALMLLFSVAYAEVDLLSMSYNELIVLHNQLTEEIMKRPEWKEVKVPSGSWIIGEDIPEGYYSITAIDKTSIIQSHKPNSANWDFYHVLGANESTGKEFFENGNIFETSNAVILSPPLSLGF